MRTKDKNTTINEALTKLYNSYSKEFADKWKNSFDINNNGPAPSINEFGIIDTANYNPKNGILFIAKETRNWDFALLPWLKEMAQTRIPKTNYPKIWYNIGRWAKLILDNGYDIETLLSEKNEALKGLSYIAFTNLNKIGGYNTSGKSYSKLLENELVFKILTEEIKIIAPRIIVLCGINKRQLKFLDTDSLQIIEMPHPSARNISNKKMLLDLKAKLASL